MCLRSFALRRAPILPYFRTISRWCVVPKISHHRFAASCTDDQYPDSTTYSFTLPKRVIVIGGGFGGSKVSKLLEKEHTFQVILITPGSTFDYIPSYPFLLGKNPHAPSLEKIQCPHRSFLSKTKIVKQNVKAVHPRYVQLEDGEILYYDSLVIASGSYYHMPFNGERIYNATKAADMLAAAEALQHANSACVVGSGPVGVEVASEIAVSFPHIKLTIVSSSHCFLERTVPKAHRHVEKFFESFPDTQVTLRMGEKVHSYIEGIATTNSGAKVDADLLFPCLGFRPRSDFMSMRDTLTEDGFIQVEPTLQVTGHENIFAVGDVTSADNEKLAQNAELHADVVVKNLLLRESGPKSTLKTYTTGHRIMVISLGPKRSVLVNGNSVLSEGTKASWLKSLVEKKSLFYYS